MTNFSARRSKSHRSDRTTAVWIILLAATIFTAALGFEDHSRTTTVGIALLAVAFFKVRLVIVYFMEVHTAPAWLQFATEAWIVIAFALLTGILLLTGQTQS
ncbi:cytochrome C oxidase subunit IV family protein [Mycolicibacterium neoaurum]|uniref:cytochrome C oxidase subunit IV family protein n=1 Tax=Mycolicibacterium neoaurum TaxID=1795 RepID=UPI00267305E5|nr:cytochrome C oxidase subunit IV family protein [Mycolicibacterium neoaurum]MDO3398988.1 cytochrome C oxidase subunit IV family protein [Mycolicibacterium neoaurum]